VRRNTAAVVAPPQTDLPATSGKGGLSLPARQTPLIQKPDAALVTLASSGDDAAFAAIVVRYGPSLYRRCRALLRDDRAEDAVQQTFVRALQALRSGTGVHDLGPWLHRIARNASINELRARGWDHDELKDVLEDCSRSEEFEHRELLRETLRAVEELPARQRIALLLATSGGAPAAIAAELGISVLAARQLVHRARTNLRAAVRAAIPPPVVWVARRVAEAADRVPAAPTLPAGLAPLAAKVAAIVVAAAAASTPVTLMQADRDSLASSRGTTTSAAHGLFAAAVGAGVQARAAGASLLGAAQARLHADPGAGRFSVGATSNSTNPGFGGPGGQSSNSSSTAPSSTDPTATAASSGDPTSADSSCSDPSCGCSDPSCTDTTSTDATSTDPTCTDLSCTGSTPTDTTPTDTTATDTTATDTTSTDTTSTDTTATDTTSTDTTATAPTAP
jgi:RNA polymerase sigma factor (sigma-70 family)